MAEDWHADVDTLAALILGALDGAESRRVEEHLASGCARCHRDREWAERVVALGRSDRATEPPPHVFARAMRLFQVERGGASDDRSQWRRFRALSLFDSRGLASAIGARGAGTTIRQVLYGVSELNLEVDVQVHRGADTGNNVWVHGQVFSGDGSNVAGLPVLLDVSGGQGETETSPLGDFRLEVPEGAGNLVLRMHGSEIEIPIPTP
jgi:hypothetical protein